MIEIEEEYKLLEWIKHLQDEYASGAWNKDDDVKFKQILQDHEKAKKWDKLALDEKDKDIILHGAKIIKQNQKLRELVEKEFQYYDITFKKHKDIDDFKIAQVLTNLLRKSKNDKD